MDMFFEFALVVLATYRIARMVASERGPFEIFHKLRTAVYKRWPDNPIIERPQGDTSSFSKEFITGYTPSWQFDGITCVDCLSFWLAWVTALALPFVDAATYAVSALAISAMCVLINHNSK